ncbi:hypothetical protein AB0F07_21250 [Streptomyces fructofermentans]|uniref:hypothetical protein n=1 Tax=Streptomyces fructofermentans TaxID=152141 RepID=UPI0033C41C63
MATARRTPDRSGSGTATVRLVPQDPEWLHDFHMTHDLVLAPYHAARSVREHGVGEHLAPAYPAGLEELAGLDAAAALDAWSNIHGAFPPPLRSRRAVSVPHASPAHRSALRAPDGRRLVPLHPVTVDEADLRVLRRVRRVIRAAAKATPSLVVTRHVDGSADIESVASPGDYRGTVDRTVAVLTLAPDEDVAVLASALAPERFGAGTRRVDLTDREYAAYDRFADRLAAAAMTGQFAGERGLFRSRY